MKWLLDTCVISELVSKKPNENVVRWIDDTDPDCLFLSVITIGEIRKGIEKLSDSQRRQTLQLWLAEELPIMFVGRILSLDFNILIEWGSLTGHLEKQVKSMSAIDSLLAATALEGNYILVTRNVNDFINAGVKTFNPWDTP